VDSKVALKDGNLDAAWFDPSFGWAAISEREDVIVQLCGDGKNSKTMAGYADVGVAALVR
jgi:hypothetical protein